MRLFLDECVDRRLARHITGHDVKTARDMAIQNGALLALASRQLDAFVTVDRNLKFQQNFATLPMPIIVLRAQTNRLADLIPLMPMLERTLVSGLPNSVTTIS